MAHSEKPHPLQDLQDDAYMGEEGRYHEEVLYWEGAQHDRFDGFDVGDLNNPAAWEDDDDGAAPTEPFIPAPAPPRSHDDIPF